MFYAKESRAEKNMDGYLTVEASLLMPVVLYVCVFVMYMGFFEYDRCIVKQDAYRAALRGSSLYRCENDEIYRAAEDTWKKAVKNQMIAAGCEAIITVSDRVAVDITGEIKMPFKGLAELTGSGRWRIEEHAESKCINPVLFIRACRGLRERSREKQKE